MDIRTALEIDTALLKGLTQEQSQIISVLMDTSKTLVELYDQQKKLTEVETLRADKNATAHQMCINLISEYVIYAEELLAERDRARATAARYIEHSMECEDTHGKPVG